MLNNNINFANLTSQPEFKTTNSKAQPTSNTNSNLNLNARTSSGFRPYCFN